MDDVLVLRNRTIEKYVRNKKKKTRYVPKRDLIVMLERSSLTDNTMTELFREYCRRGRVELAKMLYATGNIGWCVWSSTFRNVCLIGYQKSVEWLCGLDCADSHTISIGFEHACRRGHIGIAKILYKKCKPDIHMYNDKAFRSANRNRQIDVCVWLRTLEPNYQFRNPTKTL